LPPPRHDQIRRHIRLTSAPPSCAQSAQLAAKQQAEQADTSARLAALEAERAALQGKLAAEKARASEALTLEQLKQQHNERWWFTKQVCGPLAVGTNASKALCPWLVVAAFVQLRF